MSDENVVSQINPPNRNLMFVRLFGWSMLAILAAFLVNNILNVGWNMPGLSALFTPGGSSNVWVPVLIYLICLIICFIYVQRTRSQPLRRDAMLIHDFNCFLIRFCFWAVFLVGIADALIAVMRVENMLDVFFSEQMVKDLTRAQFVAPYIHIPLIAVSFLIALFSRTLGFPWLALLIVAAELLIVISRFGFSYEQALMADLVRYWYAALFLFASAFTLFEDGHVRVDVLYAGFGKTKKGIVNAWGSILLGMSTMWVILWIGLNSRQSIINSPVMNFEVTQSGSTGMFVKYQMAAFLGVFAITMLIQFVSYYFESIADFKDEPGHRETTTAAAH